MTDFNTQINGDYLMTVNHCTAGLNMPPALKSQGEGKDEIPHSLPPYKPRRAFLVDEYPACPKDWLRSSGRIKSYFVPIVEGAGLWLDFNYCGSNHPNHVAVVTSVQGVNAITGLPCKDPALEQYRDQCPKHKKDFGPDRLCNDCGFKWPKQNYMASTAQGGGSMWLDGFRAEDGFIRQYVFTAQQARGVAKAIIGGDRVFALGISFFLSKEPRPKPQHLDVRGYGQTVGTAYLMQQSVVDASEVGEADCCNASDMIMYDKSTFFKGNDASSYGLISSSSNQGVAGDVGPSCPAGILGSIGRKGPAGPTGQSVNSSESVVTSFGQRKTEFLGAVSTSSKSLGATNMLRSAKSSGGTRRMKNASVMYSASVDQAPIAINAISVKQLEVAAGARIAQRIEDDPNDLEFWQKEPEGIIIVNYVTESDCERIIKAGRLDLSGHREGFLQSIPVGNP